MKSLLRCLILLTLLCLPLLSFAANPVFQSNQQEIQYLEDLVKAAKENGSAVDPAWMARLQELWSLQPKPAVIFPPAEMSNAVDPNTPLQSSLLSSQDEYERLRDELQAMKARGEALDPALVERLNQIAPAPVIIESGEPFNAPIYEGAEAMRRYEDPLERQIRELENEIYQFTSAVEPPAPTEEQIERLNALYAQRPVNQRPYDRALDQGNDNCPATVIPGVPYSDAGTTVGRARNFDPTCDAAGSTAPDVIYQFTPALTNQYIVTATTSYNSVLSIRTTGACPGTTELGCSNGGAVSSITLTLNSGVNYWFIVGGQNASSGTYTLTVTDSCSNPCLGADIAECAETPANDFGMTDCDGGCNLTSDWSNPPNLFGTIQFGQTICGRGFTYRRTSDNANFRDTDWYKFVVTEPCTVKASLEAEFSAQLLFLTDACPTTILLNTSNSQCRPMDLSFYFAVPDTYIVFVSPLSTSGIPIARPYRLTLTCCPVVATLNAPAQVTGNTCGARNDCSFRSSEDLTYKIVISRQSYWRIYTCSLLPVWDSVIYLSTQCCGGTTLVFNDDGCNGIGFSLIDCIFLQPGTYYLTVEGFNTASCGDFQLTVSECYGRCCYDDPANPQCVLTDTVRCTSLYGGNFLVNTTCETAPCDTTHFLCEEGAEFGQIPHLSGETGANGVYSSIERVNFQRSYDDYSVSRPITHVRFWGTGLSSVGPCTENPFSGTISFHPDSGIFPNPNPVATYSLLLTGVFTQNLMLGVSAYPCYQFDAEIWPPCSLLTGWISIYDLRVNDCHWAWQTSPHGNDTSALRVNNSTTSLNTTRDLAFCLGTYPYCGLSFEPIPPQQVTIKTVGNPNNPDIRLAWIPSDTATYEIWSTIYPNNDGNPDNGNDTMWVLEARVPVNFPLPPTETWVDTQATVIYKNYVITQGCRPPNDACDSPIYIGKGATDIDTRGSSTDGPLHSLNQGCTNSDNAASDIWYVYTAPATEPDTLEFCPAVGGTATFDTEVLIYPYNGSDDCPVADDLIACNDDFCGLRSRVAWNSTAGTQYLIRIAGFNGATGTGRFVIY